MRRCHPLIVLTALAVMLGGCGLGGSDGAQPPVGDEVAGRLATDGLQDWGCGHAFTVGTPDQEVRLSLWFDGSAASAVPDPGTDELGGDWTGELVAGRDLFAQWCDDVVTPDEPEVVEAAPWVVQGTLTWQLEDGDGQCPSVATASLTDAAVVIDGEAVPIADVAFVNEHFGCVAG